MPKKSLRAKKLVIVESPTKAKTLTKYLGKNFVVKASVGHIKDLPEKRLGVDVDNGFQPEYTTIRGKGQVIKELKTAAKEADNIYLGPDPDREGEAIAWHIAQELNGTNGTKGDKIYRVLFNEITKNAVVKAIQNPIRIDENKVNAQIARRILDRLVGYKISPLLWKKVQRGLSAGRVQSVALRLIYEREKAIQSFVSEEYWSVTVNLKTSKGEEFEAKLHKIDENKISISNVEDAKKIEDALKTKTFIIKHISRSERKRNPLPPFITSTLQQEAASIFGYSARWTMMIAQRLYEGIDMGEEGVSGLITYMRTDSTTVSAEAISEVRGYIKKEKGVDYLPDGPNRYKNKKSAQEAHEAIRPTSTLREPDLVAKYLTKEEFNIYSLVWRRFVASQMTPLVMDYTSVDIFADNYHFRASGSVIKFLGFMAVYKEDKKDKDTSKDDKILPAMEEGDRVSLMQVSPEQHFTQPPPRYSEATLIRELENNGIGRPSTYATIMNIIRQREYVTIEEKGKFKPTDLGMLLSDILIKNFPKILDVEFTAQMEDQLDKIEEGKKGWVDILKEFYTPFSQVLKDAEISMRNVKAEVEETDKICERCGKIMVLRWGRYGKFLACSGYPECKNTQEVTEGTAGNSKPEENGTTVVNTVVNEECPKCHSPIKLKVGRYGKFLACSNYPACKYTKAIGIGMRCPVNGCEGEIIEKKSKKGKTFFGCSRYPECKFVAWDKPVAMKCPLCNSDYLIEKIQRRGKVTKCPTKGCSFKVTEEEKGEEVEGSIK